MNDRFKTEAVKTVDELLLHHEKRLIALAKAQKILLCGDYSKKTKAILEKADGRLCEDRYSSFILDVVGGKQLDDLNKMLFTLKKADIIILIDGKRPGTITETVFSMIKRDLGTKTLFFYDKKVKTIEDVTNCQDYHLYFMSKFGYESKEDLIKQIYLLAKQAAHRNACLSLFEEENR